MKKEAGDAARPLSDLPSHAISCSPAGLNPSISVATLRPATSKTLSWTWPAFWTANLRIEPPTRGRAASFTPGSAPRVFDAVATPATRFAPEGGYLV